jgi:hypothetical protein
MYRANQNSNEINDGKGSFLRRNTQRLAAIATIAVVGPVGFASVASAAPPPVPVADDSTTVVEGAVGPELTIPMPSPSIPDFPLPDLPEMTIPTPDGGPEDPWAPPFDPEIIPTDPVVPGENPEDDPDDETTETTVPETTVPETTVPETTVPEVEDYSDERSGGDELAYTGSDNKLPFVGAGLVAAGGLAAGLSVVSRRRRIA